MFRTMLVSVFRTTLTILGIALYSAIVAIVVVENLDVIIGQNNIWHPWIDQMVIFKDDFRKLLIIATCSTPVVMVIIHMLIYRSTRYFSLLFCALVGILCSYEIAWDSILRNHVLPSFTNDTSLTVFLTQICILSCLVTELFYNFKLVVTRVVYNHA